MLTRTVLNGATPRKTVRKSGAQPAIWPHMRELGRNKFSVELEVGGVERVPGVLQLPPVETPVPAVLLLHGLTSRKEDMASSIGHALLQRGVASLAIDLPLHGQRTSTSGA